MSQTFESSIGGDDGLTLGGAGCPYKLRVSTEAAECAREAGRRIVGVGTRRLRPESPQRPGRRTHHWRTGPEGLADRRRAGMPEGRY